MACLFFWSMCFYWGVGKYFLFRQKASKFFTETGLDWDYVISQESKRKQVLLRFFALFTQVKGISNSVKRRAYLDFILKAVQKVPGKIWQNLYLRSYLRNGDLFALSLRLLLLSLLAQVFIEQAWIATAVVVLFNYLLLFQLLALYHAFDYQYLTQLFPLDKGQKEKGLQAVVRGLTSFVFTCGISCWVDYFPRKTSPSSLIRSWFCFTSLVLTLSGQTSDAGLILLI